MNAAALHLAINHAPLFAALVAIALLSVGVLGRNRSLLLAGIWLTLIGGLCALVALQSGEAAEHLLEHAPGFNAAAIEAHEESATVAAFALLICAGIGLGIIIGARWWKNPGVERGAATVLLLGLIAATVLTAIAAHKGGYIRHAEELDNRVPVPSPSPDEE